MNGFILLVPALTLGQVHADWATQDNVDREWVLRVDPQVLDWLQSRQYKEVASNIDEREPGAKRLRIRFADGTTQPNPSPDVLTSRDRPQKLSPLGNTPRTKTPTRRSRNWSCRSLRLSSRPCKRAAMRSSKTSRSRREPFVSSDSSLPTRPWQVPPELSPTCRPLP